ncbi:MAG: hypothetical protein R3B48_03515 [Kofleriaceae bacterium]
MMILGALIDAGMARAFAERRNARLRLTPTRGGRGELGLAAVGVF